MILPNIITEILVTIIRLSCNSIDQKIEIDEPKDSDLAEKSEE